MGEPDFQVHYLERILFVLAEIRDDLHQMSRMPADVTTGTTGTTGTATWFRIKDSTSACCIDGAVGTSGIDLNLSSAGITTGTEAAMTKNHFLLLALADYLDKNPCLDWWTAVNLAHGLWHDGDALDHLDMNTIGELVDNDMAFWSDDDGHP